MRMFFLKLTCLLFIGTVSLAKTNSLMGGQCGGRGADGRIVLNFSQYPRYTTFSLSNPERLVLDLPEVRLQKKITNLSEAKLVKSIRYGDNNGQNLRLVFDLNRKAHLKHFIMPAGEGRPYRLVLDLYGRGAPELIAESPTPEPQLPRAKEKPAITITKTFKKLREVVVVIDAGHGGKDPGAKGPRGTEEKNVVLSISKKLKYLIDREPGMRAVLTRDGDYYIGLRERLGITRKQQGDVFIAIHADAYRNSSSHGASIFALSERGASSEAARWLAERENYSELGGVNLSDKSYMLRSVLIDLSQSVTIGSSLQMGSEILHRIGNMTTLHNAKVEQARFMVLKSPDTPSILIETGFISNFQEESNLRSGGYQEKLAQSILAGLRKYFREHPTPGTLLAMK